MDMTFVSWVAVAKAGAVSIGIPGGVIAIVVLLANNLQRYYYMIVAVAILSLITAIYSVMYYKRAYSVIMRGNLLINNVEDVLSDGTPFGNWSVSISSIKSISIENTSYLHLHYPTSGAKKAIVIFFNNEQNRYIRVDSFRDRQIKKIMEELQLRIDKGKQVW